MALTVTEKEHWKDRIARRIDKHIEAIFAEQPNLEDRIQTVDCDQEVSQYCGVA